ncbi:Capsular polysaccharide biosynthesis protein [Paenibacillus sophorae]|uniref:Capsular biosynthesis protein n=1 Tax=Paenibacillus sophorae TaxID=1333845 RepID=A0A1H8T8Q4_9BACL|nr:Wzz/FepE/Etk N-terminal domain-containing protein [Paenibacillus sophorae]QWU17146.1 capsular biosynthesis protein [Paenibacillus sophorae]SEO87261.1 Capsular polysaccharide biosynthesis protein [Paenibacillus sophorae]
MEKTILDYLNLIKKRLWLIVLFVLISCSTTYYVSKNYVVPVYSASAQLLVNNAADLPEGNNLNNLNFSLNLIGSYKEIIKSPAIMDRVAAAHPEFGLTGDGLSSKVTIRSSEGSQIINLSVEDKSYAKAAGIANAVSQTFIRTLPELMNLNNVNFLTPADPKDVPGPINAGFTMNLIISFVVSLMAALGIILLLETLNGSLRSEKEAVHEFGLPVIGTIPVIRKRDLGKDGDNKARVGEGAYAAVK